MWWINYRREAKAGIDNIDVFNDGGLPWRIILTLRRPDERIVLRADSFARQTHRRKV
jgi:hypothetical protein